MPAGETVFQVLNWVTFLLAVLENLALLVIATVSMEDDRRIHEKAFIVWVFSMVGHLILYGTFYQAQVIDLLTLKLALFPRIA